MPAELHEIAIEQLRNEPRVFIPRKRSGWKGVSIAAALAAGMVADWMVGYRFGVHAATLEANAEIGKANASIESANAEIKRLVGQLVKANAEITKANRVNAELHARRLARQPDPRN